MECCRFTFILLVSLTISPPIKIDYIPPLTVPLQVFFGNEKVIILKSRQGFAVHILTLGAVVQKLLVPDKKGKFSDVVLGFDTLQPYKVAPPFPPPSCHAQPAPMGISAMLNRLLEKHSYKSGCLAERHGIQNGLAFNKHVHGRNVERVINLSHSESNACLNLLLGRVGRPGGLAPPTNFKAERRGARVWRGEEALRNAAFAACLLDSLSCLYNHPKNTEHQQGS